MIATIEKQVYRRNLAPRRDITDELGHPTWAYIKSQPEVAKVVMGRFTSVMQGNFFQVTTKPLTEKEFLVLMDRLMWSPSPDGVYLNIYIGETAADKE